MQEQIDAGTPLSVTLTALDWNQVLSVLSEGPYRVVAPLIQKIGEQASVQARLGPDARLGRGNGADAAPSEEARPA